MSIRKYNNINGKELSISFKKFGRRTWEYQITKDKTYNFKLFFIYITLIGILFLTFVQTYNFNFLYFSLLLLTYLIYSTISCVYKETLLIIPSLGIQITVTNLLQNHYTSFISWNFVKDVFINEVIYRNRILFYLTILTEDASSGSQKLIPLFENTQPRLACLELIYREIQTMLSLDLYNPTNGKDYI